MGHKDHADWADDPDASPPSPSRETFPLAPVIADVVKTIEPLAAKNCKQG